MSNIEEIKIEFKNQYYSCTIDNIRDPIKNIHILDCDPNQVKNNIYINRKCFNGYYDDNGQCNTCPIGYILTKNYLNNKYICVNKDVLQKSNNIKRGFMPM